MTTLLTNSEIAELSERVDRWIDGQADALSQDDVSRMLAEVIELRRRRTAAALALSGRAHTVEARDV